MIKSKYFKKDSPTRSLLKAISWRVIASSTTFIISYMVVKQTTNETDAQVLRFATTIASVDVVAKLILYYFHERLWTNIYWGKYWSKKVWRRKYRKMHRQLEKINKSSDDKK